MARIPFLSILIRLVLWYSLITVVLRCPSTLTQLHDDHPQLCRPYLQVRSSVEPYLKPYLEPLYTVYAAPYVESVRPYVDKAHSKVYVPATNIARNIYERHLESAVDEGSRQTKQQWQKYAQPHVDKAALEAQKQYELYVAPYVAQSTKTLQPWIQQSRKFTVRHYQHTILPLYKKALPYAQRGIGQARYYAVHHVYPSVKSGTQRIVLLVHNNLWPLIRITYGRHIEPQLEKIRVRIASYADGRKMEAMINDVDDITSSAVPKAEEVLSSESSAVASTLSRISSSISVTAGDINGIHLAATQVSPIGSTTSVSTTHTADTPSPTVQPILSDFAKQQMSEVLSTSATTSATASATSAEQPHPQDEIQKWDVKFTRAAEQGGKDLQSRVEDILQRQTEGQVKGVGQALLTRLEVEIEEAFSKVKTSILEAVAQLPNESNSDHNLDALHSILDTVRSSGKTLKDRAQQIREWRAQHESNTHSLIKEATDSTTNVLDGIRDLGLQKIGMRWAEMDDVSYEDWQEYHQLKRRFDNLRADVLAAVSHDSVKSAISLADDVQNTAMELAQSAAKELARLKDVAKWKIEARDDTNDFSTRYATVAAAKEFGQKVAGFFAGDDAREAEIDIGDEISSMSTETTATITKTASSEITPSQEDVIMPISTASSIASEVTSAARVGANGVAESILSAAASPTAAASNIVEDISDGITSTAGSLTDSAISAGEEGYTLASSLAEGVSSTIAEVGSSFDEAEVNPTSAIPSMEPKTVIGSPLHDVTSVVSEAATTDTEDVAEEAALLDDELPQDVKEDLSSRIPSSARESVVSAASIASEYGQTATEDIIDGALQASSSLQSQLSQAGDGYTSITSSLASAAESVTASA